MKKQTAEELAEEYIQAIKTRMCAHYVDERLAFLAGHQSRDEEVKRLTEERDAYAKAMAVALKEGIFTNKELVKKHIEELLQKIRMRDV